ncbi:DUF86 domain-containing protein [Candidatus Kaiserbacteria bacterium]|nr:DUF86 domain-containing protein [Candidatus Kaiserbacteria bacterium]
MIDIPLIESKLADVQAYYNEIIAILAADAREIIADTLKLHSVERLFQLIVDTSIDINTHLIHAADGPMPEDYQSTFVVLAERNVFPMEFALRIAPSVGLRNLVVHRYSKVDVARMIDDIKKEIAQYQEYAGYIFSHLHNLH